MGLLSFVGRVLFVSVFVVSTWLDVNDRENGGSRTIAWTSKVNAFLKRFTTHKGFALNGSEILHLIVVAATIKSIGSYLFIFGRTIGATILILYQLIITPLFYDFYNYDVESKEFRQLVFKFTQSLTMLGGLMIFVAMNNSIPRRSSRIKNNLELWLPMCYYVYVIPKLYAINY